MGAHRIRTSGVATALAFVFVLVLGIPVLSACSTASQKAPLHVLIVPRFESGQISGDFPGEAQLFYEKYCPAAEEIEIPHMPSTGHFYFNDQNGVGILVTGSGKTAAGLSLTAVLSSERYYFSDTTIVSVGCSGGNATSCALGDVVLVTAACDYDLGHHLDVHEKEQDDTQIMWFPDDDFAEYAYKRMNADLCEKAYGLVKDCPLQTTEQAKTAMKENFPALAEEDLIPEVKKGTTLTGDNY